MPKSNLLLITILVLLAASLIWARVTKPEPKESDLKMKKHAELIKVAAEKIRKQGYIKFDPAKFPIAKVLENAEDVRVVFDRQIKFLPIDSVYLYSAAVIFIKNEVKDLDYAKAPATFSIGIKENFSGREKGKTLPKETDCFNVSSSIREKFDFVLKAINQSDKVSNLNIQKLPPDFNMIVTEFKDYYQVEIDWQYLSAYKINKQTGKIYDDGHKHYAPEPEDL